MMKIKVSEATPPQINYLVAKCEGVEVVAVKEGRATFCDPTDDGALNEMPINYSTNWAQGGPIIERECICIECSFAENVWSAWTPAPERDFGEAYGNGPTPLIAAMRCYVASKLGDEVNVPNELINQGEATC